MDMTEIMILIIYIFTLPDGKLLIYNQSMYYNTPISEVVNTNTITNIINSTTTYTVGVTTKINSEYHVNVGYKPKCVIVCADSPLNISSASRMFGGTIAIATEQMSFSSYGTTSITNNGWQTIDAQYPTSDGLVSRDKVQYICFR